MWVCVSSLNGEVKRKSCFSRKKLFLLYNVAEACVEQLSWIYKSTKNRVEQEEEKNADAKY